MSDRRRSRSEVMAKNSTVPQPSATPPMSPDAKTSAMCALRRARLGRRRVDHPAGGHHGAVPQRGILDGLLQRLYLPLDVGPLRDRVAQLAGARAAGRRELVQCCRESASTSPSSFCDALLYAVHENVRLHGELLGPEVRDRSTSEPSRRRTASASVGALRVSDSSSELTGSAVTLLRKSSGVIVSPRFAIVLVATVRVLSRLTSVAMARDRFDLWVVRQHQRRLGACDGGNASRKCRGREQTQDRRQHTHQPAPAQRRSNEMQAHQGRNWPSRHGLVIVLEVGTSQRRGVMGGSCCRLPACYRRVRHARQAHRVARADGIARPWCAAQRYGRSGSGSATTIPSMRRPASSTATATRASSCSRGRARGNGENRGGAGRMCRRGRVAFGPRRPG